MGPSLPRLKPAATDNMIPMDLISNVHLPRKPRMMKPLRIVLICQLQKVDYFLLVMFIHD